MKRVAVITSILAAAAIATLAWGGHELPVYPSFYPHEIEIRTRTASQAAGELRDARIQAYLGEDLRFRCIEVSPGGDDKLAHLVPDLIGQQALLAERLLRLPDQRLIDLVRDLQHELMGH